MIEVWTTVCFILTMIWENSKSQSTWSLYKNKFFMRANTFVQLNLARTQPDNSTHYKPNGCGRDYYIIKDNGGFSWVPKEKSPGVASAGGPKKYMLNWVASKPSPTHKYISDGSGWDFYVTFNSGGAQCPYVPGKKHTVQIFKDSLRAATPDMTRSRMTPDEVTVMRAKSRIQRGSITRLTCTDIRKWRAMSWEDSRRKIWKNHDSFHQSG